LSSTACYFIFPLRGKFNRDDRGRIFEVVYDAREKMKNPDYKSLIIGKDKPVRRVEDRITRQ
jgi:hypothetical protein